MGKSLYSAFCIFLGLAISGCGGKAKDDINRDYLSNIERRESYVLGTDMGKMIKNAGDYRNEFSEEYFLMGFEDVFLSRGSKGPVEEIRRAFASQDSAGMLIENIVLKGITERKARQSYMIGVFHGDTMQGSPEVFNVECFKKGFSDELNDMPLLLNGDEMNLIREESRKRIERLHQNADLNVSAEEKLIINREFMEQNAKREAVKTLPSGLQYAVIRECAGRKVSGTEKVKVNYRGFFVDGREFDSSYKKGSPAEFSLNDNIIKGWKEGLSLMRTGSRYKFFLPPHLAYGEEGFMDVAPNSALVYDIELLEIIE